jgi:hypothetical protein
MLPIASIVLAASVLLATRRFGCRGVMPVAGLLCLGATALIGAQVGVAPLAGLVAGVQVERGRSYGQTIAAAAAPAAVLAGFSLLSWPAAAQEVAAAALVEQLRAMGLETAGGAAALRQTVDFIIRLQPGLEFAWLLLVTVLAYRVSVWMAPRLQLAMPPALPLHLWRPWDELIWVLIAALAIWLAMPAPLREIGLNMAAVMGAVYAVHGLALLRYGFRRTGTARLLEWVLYVALFLTSGLSLVLLSGLGLLDTWFDWRRLRPAPAGEGPQ